MSKIEQLIKELCPGGVEYKSLPQISKNYDFKRKPITGTNRNKGIYPYYGASGIVDYIDNYIFDGDFLLISEDGNNLLSRTTPIAFSIKGKNWVNNHAHVIKFESSITQTFVESFFNLIDLTSYITGGAQPKLNQKSLNSIQIPLPPLPIQQEIVRILDTFTEAQANLEQELELRKKQYEYYRNQLFTFDENDVSLRCNALSHLTTICTGVKPIEIKETGEYKYVNAGTTESGFVDNFNSEGNIVTTPSRGQGGIGYIGFQTNKFWLGPLCYKIGSKDEQILTNKYLYHYLCIHNDRILSLKCEGGVPALNRKDLQTINIEYPLVERQQEIVSLLDKFESAIQAIEEELALRKKQYEYYREKLLSFN